MLSLYYSFYGFRKAWATLKQDDFLPWLFFSFVRMVVLQGQYAQPSSLDFAVLSGGLLLASLKSEEV